MGRNGQNSYILRLIPPFIESIIEALYRNWKKKKTITKNMKAVIIDVVNAGKMELASNEFAQSIPKRWSQLYKMCISSNQFAIPCGTHPESLALTRKRSSLGSRSRLAIVNDHFSMSMAASCVESDRFNRKGDIIELT